MISLQHETTSQLQLQYNAVGLFVKFLNYIRKDSFISGYISYDSNPY